jgi:hypothetical protein
MHQRLVKSGVGLLVVALIALVVSAAVVKRDDSRMSAAKKRKKGRRDVWQIPVATAPREDFEMGGLADMHLDPSAVVILSTFLAAQAGALIWFASSVDKNLSHLGEGLKDRNKKCDHCAKVVIQLATKEVLSI